MQKTAPSGRAGGEENEQEIISCENGTEVIRGDREPVTFSSLIDNVWLPAALQFGIPIDVFWTLNPKYMYMYQEEYIREKKEQMQMLDVSAYYQGMYVQQAIASCFSKKVRYPKKPISLEKKKTKPLSGEEQFKLWIEEYNRRFDEKQGIGVS